VARAMRTDGVGGVGDSDAGGRPAGSYERGGPVGWVPTALSRRAPTPSGTLPPPLPPADSRCLPPPSRLWPPYPAPSAVSSSSARSSISAPSACSPTLRRCSCLVRRPGRTWSMVPPLPRVPPPLFAVPFLCLHAPAPPAANCRRPMVAALPAAARRPHGADVAVAKAAAHPPARCLCGRRRALRCRRTRSGDHADGCAALTRGGRLCWRYGCATGKKRRRIHWQTPLRRSRTWSSHVPVARPEVVRARHRTPPSSIPRQVWLLIFRRPDVGHHSGPRPQGLTSSEEGKWVWPRAVAPPVRSHEGMAMLGAAGLQREGSWCEAARQLLYSGRGGGESSPTWPRRHARPGPPHCATHYVVFAHARPPSHTSHTGPQPRAGTGRPLHCSLPSGGLPLPAPWWPLCIMPRWLSMPFTVANRLPHTSHVFGSSCDSSTWRRSSPAVPNVTSLSVHQLHLCGRST